MSALQLLLRAASESTGTPPPWLTAVVAVQTEQQQRGTAVEAAPAAPPATAADPAPPQPEAAPQEAPAATPQKAVAEPQAAPQEEPRPVETTPVAAPPSQSLAVAEPSQDLAALDIEYARLTVADARRRIGGGLHACHDWLRVKEDLFRSAAIFQAYGLASEAAEAFDQSASVLRIMGVPNEVVATTSFAIEGYKQAGDLRQSIALLVEQYELHLAAGRKLSAARALRQIAEIYQTQDGCAEEALQNYVAAIPLYESDAANCRDQLLTIRFKVACLFAITRKYRESTQTFEVLAEKRQLTSRTQCYFLAMLAHLCDTEGEKWAGGLARSKKMFEVYQDADKQFQMGAEHQLIRGLMDACHKPSLAMLDAAMNKYRLLRPNDPDLVFIDDLVGTIRDHLFQYMRPYM